jgi:DNA-binding IclR family transcriptional regulator
MTPPVAGREPTDLIRSVSRALRILEEVAGAPSPIPVKVIARRCGLNLSTAYHLARTLCYEGYLVRQADGSYVVGPQLAERFHELVGSLRRPPSASTVLRHLAETCQHTAYLARITGDRMVIAEVAEGPRSPWLEDLQVGLDTAAHATALGKSLLTTLPRRRLRAVLSAQGLPAFTPNTPRTVDDVEGEVRRLRPGDLVIEVGQFRENVACASVTVPAEEAATGSGAGWWAVGVSARGEAVPDPVIAHLRRAATDLAHY